MKKIDLDGNYYDRQKKELNLSHRNLREFDTSIIAAHCNVAQYLDLSHNRIRRLEWLYEFPDLKCLILDDNRLREAHLATLKVALPNITTLTLNKNELSDLCTTAKILQYIFPNLEYLSLHGNPMCPDELCLQPFSEFVPYEYTHYRNVLKDALPHLKFLDHISLESLRSHPHNLNQDHCHQQQPIGHEEQMHSTARDLWSKLKGFIMTSNHNDGSSNIITMPSNASRSNYTRTCETAYDSSYRGGHSEGNRFITNADL